MPDVESRGAIVNDAKSQPSFIDTIVGSPVLWGGAVTWLFYASVPVMPLWREEVRRYFCSHPLEYALVGLFFVGLAILTKRVFRLGRERAVLARNLLPTPTADSSDDEELPAKITEAEQHLIGLPQRLRETQLHGRLRETCSYLRGAKSASGLEAHLKHLSETAADRLHDSYSLLLTINWAVPIIGFLGTVIGITLAIANVTPEQLDTSLNSVTGGLAVAFDTTTVAMSFSLVLVFAYDWIKRSEQRVLAAVDDIALRDILPYFATSGRDGNPLAEAQAEAARELIERTESLIHEQTQAWKESVDGMRERWADTLTEQQQQLSAGLNAGVDSTLSDHAGQLRDVREDFLKSFQSATERFTHAMIDDRAARVQHNTAAQQQFEQVWQRVNEDLQTVIRSHDTHTEDMVDGLMQKLSEWQTGLERSTRTVEGQLDRLQELTDTLLRLSDQQQQLETVERQLSQNLEAVRAAETFEQTLHNLTAAVHLLTARAKPKAA